MKARREYCYSMDPVLKVKACRWYVFFFCCATEAEGASDERARAPAVPDALWNVPYKEKTAAETVYNRLRPPNQKRHSGLDRGTRDEHS